MVACVARGSVFAHFLSELSLEVFHRSLAESDFNNLIDLFGIQRLHWLCGLSQSEKDR